MNNDFMDNLDKRHLRSTYKCIGNIIFQTYKSTIWCGFDLSDKPYGICIKDRENNIILYSTMLYKFKTREAAEAFCALLIEQGPESIEMFQKELIAHWAKFNIILHEKCQEESQAFKALLEPYALSVHNLLDLYNKFQTLPRYIKEYLKHFDE